MSDMVDLSFDLKGGFLPAEYPFALWQEMVNVLPWLDTELRVGVLPLRGAVSDGGMLLPQRAKLVLRLPADRVEQARLLSGCQLEVKGDTLSVGKAGVRPIQAHSTLHAHMVESADNEETFLATVSDQLKQMQIACKWICGKRGTKPCGSSLLSGYSLVLHDLKPPGSMQLQGMGLGGSRRFGCGIFVPYKVISGLD